MTATNANPNNPVESSDSTNPRSPEQAEDGGSLTAFQRNLLVVLEEHDGSAYGLKIKRGLETEAYYDEEVNHGRLYPNLDTLIEVGLVEKSELDKRTNLYELTEDGRDVLETLAERYHSALNGDSGSLESGEGDA